MIIIYAFLFLLLFCVIWALFGIYILDKHNNALQDTVEGGLNMKKVFLYYGPIGLIVSLIPLY